MKIASIGFIAATALASISTGASADIVTETFTGTVLSGADAGGLFGATGINLTGDSFTATYVINTDLAGAIQYNNLGGYYGTYGGTYQGASVSSPVINASITINGVTVNVGTSAY
jgi:hypothetical protein